MDIQSDDGNGQYGSWRKSAVFVILLVVASVVAYYAIKRLSTYVSQSPEMIDLYYKKAAKFTEEQKDAINKNHAGLWTYGLDMMVNGSRIRKIDRLEIKDNGIAWQVVQWDIPMPSDTVATYYHIRTAYMKPFGALGGDTLNDVNILLQAFIRDGDTLFGNWFFSEMWEAHRDGADLVCCKRRYTPYAGDVAGFFPPGAIDLVLRAESQFYKDSAGTTQLNKDLYVVEKIDPETGKTRLFPIRDDYNGLYDLVKSDLYKEFVSSKMKTTCSEAANVLITQYFQPFVIGEQWRAYPRPTPRSIPVSFVIKNNGSVENIELPPLKQVGKIVLTGLKNEIVTWRFPPTDAPADAPVKVSFDLEMP